MGVSGNLFIVRLDDQRYAFALSRVERVVRMVEITPMPQAPEGVLGVVNLQGRIVEVLDLRRHLQPTSRPPRASDLLVIAQGAEKTVALVADTVGDIAPASALEAAGEEAPIPPGSDFVTKVLKVPDGLVLVCDLDRIVSALEARTEHPPLAEPAAPQDTFSSAAGELRQTLRERARRLAQEPLPAASPDAQLELVHFLLATERYGIETAHVREVYPYRELVRLPGAPPFVMGIMNVRGKIHSVVDLRRLLDLPANPVSEGNKVIFLQGSSMAFGVMADAILGVQQVGVDEVQAPLATLTGMRAAYVKGVTAEGLTVLDGEKILADRKLVVHQEI